MGKRSARPFTALLLVLVIGTSFITRSSGARMASKELVGIWELFYQGKPTGMFKIMEADGKITNMAPAKSGFVITLTGKFEITSDSTYTEKIDKSFNPGLSGTSNNITYKMENRDNLAIKFFVNGNPYTEQYRRVPFAIGF